MRKFALAIIALISCCIFFSCSKPSPTSNEFIMLSLATDESGMINQGLHFSVGSKKLKAAGFDENEIQEFKTRLIEQIKVFHDEFYLSFLLTYTDSPQTEYQIGKAVIVTEPVYTNETDTVGFNMLFTSQKAWNFYHQSGESDEGAKTSRGFMITTRQSGIFPFSAKANGVYAGQRFLDAYIVALGDKKVDYNPDFVYDYATPSRYLKSDSDCFFESGLYHHVWIRKLSQFENSTITLYTSFPNAPIWYLTLLIVTLAGLGAAIVIIKYKNKKNI